jgi:hypothetical protein
MNSPLSSYLAPLSTFTRELEQRMAAMPPLSYHDCESLLCRLYSNSSPQSVAKGRRELARTCRSLKALEGRAAAKYAFESLRRYVWTPFERLREDKCANRAAATRRRTRRMRAEGRL